MCYSGCAIADKINFDVGRINFTDRINFDARREREGKITRVSKKERRRDQNGGKHAPRTKKHFSLAKGGTEVLYCKTTSAKKAVGQRWRKRENIQMAMDFSRKDEK